ncbi:hypothetical protein [Streptomyces sp. NBC_01465]|uniref:hypothetical protein n=1 Tax=Streptomyces sp. NBC_01465 TaxID=2903878 RepID=UPI002E379D24|nr:hypothetical protein [Streptomyces sp. NBC_01465]
MHTLDRSRTHRSHRVRNAAIGLAAASAVGLGVTAAIPADPPPKPASHTAAQKAPDVRALSAPGQSAQAACNTGYTFGNSLIKARWQRLGGSGSGLGCPRSNVKTVRSNGIWKGERQYFEHGTITWSPSQGPRMVLAAWDTNGYAILNWSTTNPFSYKQFLVRYYSAADFGGTQVQVGSGTSGGTWVRKHTTGEYRFIVEGCDDGRFGKVCRQGWTLSATTR